MATIGLDKLYYAKITEDADGFETYSTPVQLAKAMTADLSVELAEATLYADDGTAESVREFKSGTLPTSRVRLSTPMVLSLLHRKMVALPWLSVSVQRKATASISISGSTA